MDTSSLISVENLVKEYQGVRVLDGVSLEVGAGVIFGLLGRNGAGKTSLMEILEGLRPATSGKVRVCGLDPWKNSVELKRVVGAQRQESVLNDLNTTGEIFRLFSSFYAKAEPWRDIMCRIGLDHKEKELYRNLSGGQRQLLAIGLALLGNPHLLFLDEPTVGLDVHARSEIHSIVRSLKSKGTTVVLSTHYLEEAEELCDTVAILNAGRLVTFANPEARDGENERSRRELHDIFVEITKGTDSHASF